MRAGACLTEIVGAIITVIRAGESIRLHVGLAGTCAVAGVWIVAICVCGAAAGSTGRLGRPVGGQRARGALLAVVHWIALAIHVANAGNQARSCLHRIFTDVQRLVATVRGAGDAIAAIARRAAAAHTGRAGLSDRAVFTITAGRSIDCMIAEANARAVAGVRVIAIGECPVSAGNAR